MGNRAGLLDDLLAVGRISKKSYALAGHKLMVET